METSFLKKFPIFTNKPSRAKRNCSVPYDDLKSPDGIRWLVGNYEKPLFKILSGFLHFWPLSSQKVLIVSSKGWKLFFFKYGEWGIKKSIFSYLFQKLNLILVKSAHKKSFSKKNVFPTEKLSPR